MDIVGQIGYWLLVALAAILTLGVRTKLDAGSHTILGALFFVSGAVVITASGADKTHALWVIPSGFFIAVLMAYLSAQSALVCQPLRRYCADRDTGRPHPCSTRRRSAGCD
jgi:hypothetical protein